MLNHKTTMTQLSPLTSHIGLCPPDNREYIISRCIKVYRFEPHTIRKILLVIGEVTVSIVNGTTYMLETQRTEEFKKYLQLMGLGRSSNIDVVAEEILTNCPYIDHSMKEKLKENLEEISQRDYDYNGIIVHQQIATDGTFLPRYPEIFDDYDQTENDTIKEENEPEFENLNEYIELLYEEIPQKIEGSSMIGKLTKCNSYLSDIAQHDSFINALFRTLREDCKKSTQLTKNILSVSLDFAKFKQFQGILIQNKIPQLTLDIIDFELERCEKWKIQLQQLEEKSTNKIATSKAAINECRLWMCFDERVAAQNALLKENRSVRQGLISQKVLISLVDCLERRDKELLDVVLAYLKDLSCFKQGIDDMVAVDIVDKLARVLKGGFPIPKTAVNSSLHLLYNLSFQKVLRERILDCGLVPIIAKCLAKSSFKDISIKVLYVLSMEPLTRNKFAKSSVVIQVMDYLINNNSDEGIPVELGSLAINLSSNKRCGELMCENNNLGRLVQNAIKNEDFLAMKIIRNLAEQESKAFILYECVSEIAGAMRISISQEFLAECVGTLACFDPSRLDIQVLSKKGKIFSWLKQTLAYYVEGVEERPTEVSADLIRSSIDALQLLGTLSQSEEGARIIIGDGFAELLMKVLHTVNADFKILQQVLSTFIKSTKHESISVFLALKTRVPQGLLRFAENISSYELKCLCVSAMENIAIFDETWRDTLQQYHFLEWNQEWTHVVTLQEDQNDDEDMLNILGATGEDVDEIRRKRYAKSLEEIPNHIHSYLESESGSSDIDDFESMSSEQENFFTLFRQQFEEETAVSRQNRYWESTIQGIRQPEFYDSDSEPEQ